MRKTFILFCLVCIAFPGKGLAQIYTAEDNPMFSLYKNSVFLEAGGNAIVGSVNYERLLPLRSFSRQTIAVRAGMLPLRQGNEDLLVLPLEVSTFWGHRFVKPKFAEWELKGVPVRVAIGPRDLENGTAEVARRDTKEKQSMQLEGLENTLENLLNEIQENIYNKAFKFREENTTKVDSYEEFKRVLDEKPGFVLAHWDGTPETEERIKEETKATIRCIALETPEENGVDMVTGKPSSRRVYFARAY